MLGVAAMLGGCAQETDGGAKTAKKAKPKKAKVHLVQLVTVEQRSMRATSTHTGSLRYRTTVRIFNQEEGRLLSLPWFEGDAVEKGGTLFALDSTLLKAQLRKADAVLAEANANVKRTKRLLGRKMISDEEHLRTTTALEVARAERSVLQTRLGFTRVAAPFAGLIVARHVEPGDIVARHTHMLTLVDPSSLVTEINVSETLIPHLGTTSNVAVKIDALGDAAFPGKVIRIHPQLNARTRQGRVEIELTPLPVSARAGLFARVTFNVDALKRTVMPFSAVRRDRDGEYVFRVNEKNIAERRSIRGGRRLSDQVEVREGLKAGDRVVTKGFLGLKNGNTVTPVEPDVRGQRNG
jgi:RND family efflux transporter MFP subunit